MLFPRRPYGIRTTKSRRGRERKRSDAGWRLMPALSRKVPTWERETPGAVEDRQRTCASAVCRQALDGTLIDAIALWRAACARCARNYLEAIEINGKLFLDERIARSVELRANEGSGVEYFNIRYRPLVRYVPASPAAMTALGAASPTGEWVAIAAFARHSLPAPEIIIRLGGPSAACGGDASLIACAGADANVELNARDFRFVRQSTEVLGAGSQSVDPSQVLIHEVGHWFGLPHIDPAQGLGARRAMMEEVYGLHGQCITGGELGLLDDASDLTWSQRLRACSGLRYPRLARAVR